MDQLDQCEPIRPGALGYQILRSIYEAAVLATKLRYIDAEAKSRAELLGYFGLGSKFPDNDQTRDSLRHYISGIK